MPFISHDLSTGQFTPAPDFRFPYPLRHGSVLPITTDELERLKSAYLDSQKPAAPAKRSLIDYFQSIPVKGKLSADAWGAADVGPRDPDNGLEDRDLQQWCYWDGKPAAQRHGYRNEGSIDNFFAHGNHGLDHGQGAWWSVPLSMLIGVPMYSNAAGIIPIVKALLEKGAALGTVLAFMMAVIGLSLPEVIILRNVLKPRLIAAFVGIVACGILIVGYLFNLFM